MTKSKHTWRKLRNYQPGAQRVRGRVCDRCRLVEKHGRHPQGGQPIKIYLRDGNVLAYGGTLPACRTWQT